MSADLARRLVLPWSVVCEWVSRHDIDGRALRAALASAGWTLAAVELPPLDCLDRTTFEQQTDDAYMQMQIAERLGADLVIVSSGHAGSAGYDLMTDALTRLTALSERMDVRLCLRNEKDSALEQIDALRCAFDRVGSDALGFCLDNLALQQAVQNPADAVLCLADRIVAARLRDAVAGRPCAPARGCAHVPATLAALADEGFAGPVIVDAAWVEDAARRFVHYWQG